MKYDFTPQAREEILAAIKKRAPIIICTICRQSKWTMPDGFSTLPLLSNLWAERRISGLPCVALICDFCGNTLLINLMILGLGHLVGPNPDEIKRRMQPEF